MNNKSCTQCNAALDQDAKFCAECGAQTIMLQNKSAEKKKDNKVPVISGIVGVLVLAVIVLVIALPGSDAETHEIDPMTELYNEMGDMLERLSNLDLSLNLNSAETPASQPTPTTEQAHEEPDIPYTPAQSSPQAGTQARTTFSREWNDTPVTWRRSDVPTTLSDNLHDIQIEILGHIYSFPMHYQELLDLGWVKDERVNPDEHRSFIGSLRTISMNFFHSSNPDINVSFWLSNLDVDTRHIYDSFVTGVRLGGISGEGISPALSDAVRLPGGISMTDATPDDIIAIFGEPFSSTVARNRVNINYSFRFNTHSPNYVFNVYEAGGIHDVNINLHHNTLRPFQLAGFTNSLPNPNNLYNVNMYAAPAGLGTNPASGIIEIYGQAVSVPFPVRELTSNGWSMASDTIDVLQSYSHRSGATGGITLTNGSSTSQRFGIINFSTMSVTPENSLVFQIIIENPNIMLPGGISVGMSREGLETVLIASQTPVDVRNHGRDDIYAFLIEDGSRHCTIQIFVDNRPTSPEYNQIRRIDISRAMFEPYGLNR